MLGLVRDWRYRLKSRQLLRHIGTPEAHRVLNDPDSFDSFCEGLPSTAPPEVMGAVGDGQPILDAIKQFFAWAWAHKEEIIKFILELIALFPKAPAPESVAA